MAEHSSQPAQPAQSAQEPQSSEPAQSPQPEPMRKPTMSGGATQPAQPRRSWRSLAEERIAQARDRGDFDNLPGVGKPLRLDENVYAGGKALAYHLLKQNNTAPPELERGAEVDRMLANAERELAALRRRHDTLLARGRRAYASERRVYNLVRDKAARRYAEELRAINSNILSLNIIAPSALGRPLLDVEQRLAAFEDEFPRVAE